MNVELNLAGKSHRMPVAVAAEWTKTYQENRNVILKPEFQNKDVLSICETFNATAVQELLNLPGCTGFRIYYGMDEAGQVHAILCGANEKGEDLYLPSQSGYGLKDGEGDVLENGQKCPPECPPVSPLNT